VTDIWAGKGGQGVFPTAPDNGLGASKPKYAAPPGEFVTKCMEKLCAEGPEGGWAKMFEACKDLGPLIQKAWTDFWVLFKKVSGPDWKEGSAIDDLEVELNNWACNLTRKLPNRLSK
jgi:hypothetical protein